MIYLVYNTIYAKYELKNKEPAQDPALWAKFFGLAVHYYNRNTDKTCSSICSKYLFTKEPIHKGTYGLALANIL